MKSKTKKNNNSNNSIKKTKKQNNKLSFSSKSSFKFKKANYYYFYRLLEKKHERFIREKICLVNVEKINTFKLDSFTIDSELNESSVIQCWIQEYSNNSKEPVEAKYQLPLSPSSIVSRFVVEYKGKVLEAKIKEKSKAQERYNDSIASGGQAFIGEKSDDGLFYFIIGNLPPQEKVTIKLTIVSEVGTHLSSLHCCLHRYMFPLGKFNFNFNLNVSLASPIKEIKLDYYNPTITYTNDKMKSNIQFSTNDGLKQSIITMVQPELSVSDRPQSFIAYSEKDKSYAFALNFYPVFDQVKLEDINQKSEYIFVIDYSVSMRGKSIEKAIRALDLCVRSLNYERSKFNIYCFGSNFVKCFEQSQIYNDESLSKASIFIDNIKANSSGTELFPPIADILSKEYDLEYPRQVFILTDGEVYDRDRLIEYVAKESNTTRIFTFGIGGADKNLVIGLSKVCKGYYEFIYNTDDMEEKILKLLNIANEPTLSNISIDWGLLKVEQAPTIVRPIFNKERMVVYGLLNSDEKLTNKSIVKMIGNGPTGEILEFSIELDFNNVDTSSNKIHTLTAYKQIKDLEEQERKKSNQLNKDRIIQLGKKYNLVSKYTSFIITVEGEGEIVQNSMKSIDITEKQPINFTSSRNSVDNSSRVTSKKSKSKKETSPFSPNSSSEPLIQLVKSKSKKETSPFSSNSSSEPLIQLVKSQNANGSWSKSSIKSFSIDTSKAPKELSKPEFQDIWTTLLVIAKFYKDFLSQKYQWERVVLKSIKWVKQQLTNLNLIDQYNNFETLSNSLI